MITYAEREVFSRQHVGVFRRVEAIVSRVSDAWGNELRCHELARAVHRSLDVLDHGLVVVDGKCGPIEHSWLVFGDGTIVDPYVPGRMPAVQLVDAFVATRLYYPGADRSDIRIQVVDDLVAEMQFNARSFQSR